MIDPYTAFGLVGSIEQLVDFGLKIISNAREISSTGLPAEYKTLENIANDVTVQTKRLSARQADSLISGCLSEDEQVRDFREETEIEALEKRLNDLRDELALHMSISTNVGQRDLFDSLKSLDQSGKLTFEAISQNNKLLKEFMEQNKSSA